MKDNHSRYRKPIPDLNAYEKSYKLGMSLALSKKPLDLKLNPYSSIFRPSSNFSFGLGLKSSYQKGLEIRENSLDMTNSKLNAESGNYKNLERIKSNPV